MYVDFLLTPLTGKKKKKNQSLLLQEEQIKAIQMAVCTGGRTDELGFS